MLNMKVTVTLIITGALGTIHNIVEKRLGKLETVFTSVLFNSAKNIRESPGDLRKFK